MNGWSKTLDLGDIFHADKPFPEKRDAMVTRIRALDPNDAELDDIADELADAQDGDEWDRVWAWFYDWADYNRVWIRTLPHPETPRADFDDLFVTSHP
jgi:hypothetical protein